MSARWPDPYDPNCKTYAADMDYLDSFWAESEEYLKEFDEEDRRLQRADYVRHHEGTYNRETGHFLCDSCYIDHGQSGTGLLV